ncbi:hypothetical protein BSNK01_14330 [Bacillaceae bacterium]
MNGHQIIRSKWKKTLPLLNDPILCRHVPETHFFNKERLEKMLQTYSSVYVKPNIGRKGYGIQRFKRLGDAKCELSMKNASKILPLPEAVKELTGRLEPEKTYLVQEGIDLATYNHCPFHVRMVMQKPHNRWQLSLTSALVARHENAVVTNFSQGNLELTVEEVLANNDQRLNPLHTFRELIDISHQICFLLGSQFPLLIIGLDLGIDKKGKVWFIEANTNPDCYGMDKVNDKLSCRKYLAAKQWIRKNQGGCKSKV